MKEFVEREKIVIKGEKINNNNLINHFAILFSIRTSFVLTNILNL